MFVFLYITASLMTLGAAQEGEFDGFRRGVGFTLSGGYTHTESFGSVPEFTAEFQFRIAPRVYAAVAVGYLGDTISMHNSGMMVGAPMGFEDHLHRFQVVPITLNVYYSVPISRTVAAYLTAGGGYYAATYWDINTQSEGNFGSHMGAGLNLRPSQRLDLFVAGTYRLARIDGFLEDILPGTVPGVTSPSTFSLSLNGFRMQFGMRFRF
jgi:hypothetical protein